MSARKEYLAGYPASTDVREHRIWLAGRDKPHRCPDCWRCSWAYVKHGWRLRKWLPRRCGVCGAIVLTTRLRRWHGKGWF